MVSLSGRAAVRRAAVGQEQHAAHDRHVHRHQRRRAEGGLRPVLEEQPEDAGRDRGHREQGEDAAPRLARAACPARRPRKAEVKIRSQSPRNAYSTAASVPTWRATSKARLCTGQPSSQGMTMRCPELLMGRNSPRPCSTPRARACHGVIAAVSSKVAPPMRVIIRMTQNGILRFRQRGDRSRRPRPASPCSTTGSPSATASTRRCARTAGGPSTSTATSRGCARRRGMLGIAIPAARRRAGRATSIACWSARPTRSPTSASS